MGIFARKRYVWHEPWFFLQRVRTAKEWVRIALILLATTVIVGGGLFWVAPAGNPINWLQIIGLSLGMAVFVWWYMDGVYTRRHAILFEDSILVHTDHGSSASSITYKLSKIVDAMIVLPEDTEWPAPVLFFFHQSEPHAIGIERKVNLKRMAQALHDAGVEVQLDGWQPNQESKIETAFSWQADPQVIVDKARMEPLLPGTPGLFTLGAMVLAVVHQLWAIVLMFLVVGGAVYYWYLNWNNLDIMTMLALIVVSCGVMYFAANFTERVGVAAASQGLIRVAKKQIRLRDGMQIDPDADELVPVSIYARDQLGKTVQKIREQGFLQADQRGRRMLFEGKKERWCLPLYALQSVAIEEVHTGTPGQSTTGEMKYYVVVKFTADEDQEFGFRYDEREFGKYDEIKRAQEAIFLYETFEQVLMQDESVNRSTI